MIYEFSEDSQLLLESALEIIKEYKHKNPKKQLKIIEIGCNTGEVIKKIYNKYPKEIYFASDIDNESIQLAKENLKGTKITLIKSDLFQKIYENNFDIVLFNPPYLPNDKEFYDVRLHGGKKGNEVSIRFLKEAKDKINQSGSIILIISTLSNPKDILETAKKMDLRFNKIKTKKLFFETLMSYRFQNQGSTDNK